MLKYKITLAFDTPRPKWSSIEYTQEYFISGAYKGPIEDYAELLRQGLNAKRVVYIELQGIEPDSITQEGLV